MCSLERQVSDLNNLKLNLSHELQQEIKKSKLLEQQLQEKNINTGTDVSDIYDFLYS